MPGSVKPPLSRPKKSAAVPRHITTTTTISRPPIYPPSTYSHGRSQSYDNTRRPTEKTTYTSSTRRPTHARHRSPEPYGPASHRVGRQDRVPRPDSSSLSPEPRYGSRYGRDTSERWDDARGRRRASLAPPVSHGRAPRGSRPSSVDYGRSSARPVTTQGGYYPEGSENPRRYDARGYGPNKYRTQRLRAPSPPMPPRSPLSPGSRRHSRDTRDDVLPPVSRPPIVSRHSDLRPPAPHGNQEPKPNSPNKLFHALPAVALAAMNGLHEISERAKAGRDWADWVENLDDTPMEIQELWNRAETARDTINQVHLTLKSRPDLVEGEQGTQLKRQIETAIGNTEKALERMRRLLADIGRSGSDHGSVANGKDDFWGSHRYREEFEGRVYRAREDVQRELSELSTLMVNIYSRALMNPAPPGSTSIPPPPIPTEAASHVGSLVGENSAPTAKMSDGNAAAPKTGDAAGKDRSRNEVASSQNNPKIDTPATTNNGNLSPPKSPQPASEYDAGEALLDAAWDGDLEAAARALCRTFPNVRDDQSLTPLHIAVDRDNLAVAMLLLDKGADVESPSEGGRTPLHLAARAASSSTVEMLLERGQADPNNQTTKGRTALHFAASKAVDGDEERKDVLRVLRDWGTDPTIRDGEGRTARDVAMKRGHMDAAAILERAERRWEMVAQQQQKQKQQQKRQGSMK